MKQNKRIMNIEMQTKIREWEAERDRNLRIHCPLVAAKFQRWIDRAKKEDDRRYFQPRESNFNADTESTSALENLLCKLKTSRTNKYRK